MVVRRADCAHGGIGGLQTNTIRFREPVFQRGLALVGLRDNDLTWPSRLLSFDDHVVAISNLGLDH